MSVTQASNNSENSPNIGPTSPSGDIRRQFDIEFGEADNSTVKMGGGSSSTGNPEKIICYT